MLILLTNAIHIIFYHDVFTPLQTDRMLRRQMIDFIYLLLIDNWVLKDLFCLLIELLINSYTQKDLPYQIVILDTR